MNLKEKVCFYDEYSILNTDTSRKYLKYFVQVHFSKLFKICIGVFQKYLNSFTRVLYKSGHFDLLYSPSS